MPEAVLDRAIEDIADGLSVDWKRMEGLATVQDAVEWAKCLRILDDIVNVHRAAAVDFEQTNLAGSSLPDSLRGAPETWEKDRLASKVGKAATAACIGRGIARPRARRRPQDPAPPGGRHAPQGTPASGRPRARQDSPRERRERSRHRGARGSRWPLHGIRGRGRRWRMSSSSGGKLNAPEAA